MSEILGVFGLQGWGKTALTTYFGILAKEFGYDVYSNYPLSFEYIPIKTLKQAQNVRNGYLLLDEIWRWVHARTSSTKINKEMMSICLLNRKRGVSIIYNTQLKRTIDVILREVTNYRYLPHMVKYEDGKKYIHYVVRDLIDRESEEMVIPMSIDEIGKCFNTYDEVPDLGTGDEPTPIQKGIGLEQDFAKAVSKIKGVNDVYVLPNSGNGSGWLFDVIVYAKNGTYAVDVKGSSKTHVYLEDYGKSYLKKIENAKKHNAIPYIAFPNNRYIRLGITNAWFMHKICENDYLKRLNSMPYYNKLVKNSLNLININFYKK